MAYCAPLVHRTAAYVNTLDINQEFVDNAMFASDRRSVNSSSDANQIVVTGCQESLPDHGTRQKFSRLGVNVPHTLLIEVSHDNSSDSLSSSVRNCQAKPSGPWRLHTS